VNATLAIALAAGGGCAATLLLWLAGIVSAVRPRPGDTAARDRAPAFWRLCRPLVAVVAAHLGPRLSVRVRFTRHERLRRAGLDYALSAEEFVAGQIVAAVLAAALVALVWSPRGPAPAASLAVAALLGFLLPQSWLRDRIDARRRAVLRELPFYLDVITLSVESGLNLGGALAQAVDKGPRGPLRAEFGRVLRDLRAGRTRDEALRALAARLAVPAMGSLVAALLVAEKQGVALGPVLRAQAEQRRTERFMRAEKLAMEAPVKMLPALLVFIFPCTFVMLLFPVASRMIQEGWLR
jgi:tight adherence protein C